MTSLDVNEAAKRLEDLIASLDSGTEHEILIEMDGAPAARLLPIDVTSARASEPLIGQDSIADG